jgi:hypothetical protein
LTCAFASAAQAGHTTRVRYLLYLRPGKVRDAFRRSAGVVALATQRKLCRGPVSGVALAHIRHALTLTSHVTRLSSTSSFPLVAVFAVCSPRQRLLPVSYLFDRPAGRDHHATRYHIYRLTAPATPQCRATWRTRRPWAVAALLMRRRPPPRSAPQIRTAAAARSCP